MGPAPVNLGLCFVGVLYVLGCLLVPTGVSSKAMTQSGQMCELTSFKLSGSHFRVEPRFEGCVYDYKCVECPFKGAAPYKVTATLPKDQPDATIQLYVDDKDHGLLKNGKPSKHLNIHQGLNKIVVQLVCEDGCAQNYTISCDGGGIVRPTPGQGQGEGGNPPPSNGGGNPPPGGVVGDPIFTGLRGQVFQVHGVANEVYNLISTAHFQLNSRFVFLDRGECPPSHINTLCWAHDGSYLGELGIQTSNNDEIMIRAGAASKGFELITFNQVPIQHLLHDTNVFKGGNLTLHTTNPEMSGFMYVQNEYNLLLKVSQFFIQITNSDQFVNLKVSYTSLYDVMKQQTHGLLGGTWKTTPNPAGKIKAIEGTIDHYRIPNQSLFDNQFTYNQFGKE